MRLAPAASIPASRIRAIGSIAEDHPGTLRLFVGEDTLPTPDFIKDAAHQAIVANKTYYTPNAGYPELREAIAWRYFALHGVEVDPTRQVVVTASGMVALLTALQATVGPGTSALVVTPAWPNIAASVRTTGAEAIEVPLSLSDDRFRLDFDLLEASVRPDTRTLVVVSPGNPTGWTATLDDWRRLVAFCERHDLWLLADSAYERLTLGSEETPAPSPLVLPEARARTIVAQTFSKAYRMTGWRVGYAIAPTTLGPTLASLQEYIVSHAAGIAQEAARVATLEGESFVLESRRRYARHARMAMERLSDLDGVTVPVPTGGLYVFPRLAGLEDSFSFCAELVRSHRLGLAPGNAFGAGGEGHVRLCFAVDEATLIEALDRFRQAWRHSRSALLTSR